MNKTVIIAAACAALASPVLAGGKYGHKNKYDTADRPSGTKIVVSCFRGPWAEIIWDRPNSVFIDSLVSVGYDFSTANAIGERVCRDQALVGDAEALKATMLQIYNDRASHRKHNY